MVEVGRLALWVALLASGSALLAGLRPRPSPGGPQSTGGTSSSGSSARSSEPGGRFRVRPGRREAAGSPVAARLLGVAVGAAAVAAGRLAWALLTNDYTFTYVADFARRDASAPYRLAALWGGMAGSLLWFATLIGAAGWWAARRIGDGRVRERMVAVTGGLLATLVGLVLGFADPFRRLEIPALDGSGLTPILEHPAMLYHPPLLYLGLATLTGPFALTVAVLLGRARSGEASVSTGWWPETVRRWLMLPWVLLAVGMLAGAHWAYVELGWGGYWAWDPVENTALLPWLAVTLALHAHQLRRPTGPGVDRGLAALVCLAFLLALVGAMLTRSGAVSSVHAFAESRAIGRALGAVVGVVAAGVAILLVRASRGDGDGGGGGGATAHPALRWLLAAHLAVVGTVLAVAFTGTVAPLVTDLRGGDGIAIEGRYFADFTGPLATVGLALIALVPVARRLRTGPAATRRLAQEASIPEQGNGSSPAASAGDGRRAGAALPATKLSMVPAGSRAPDIVGPAFGMVLGVGLLVVAGGDVDLSRLVLAAAAGAALASAATAGVRTAVRRDGPWGADLAHAGLGLLLLGVAGTATGVTESVPVEPGDRVEVLGQTVEYRGVAVRDAAGATPDGPAGDRRSDGRAADEPASVVADVRAAGRSLAPSLVAYPARGVLLAETSLVSTPWRDVQVALRDASDDGSAVLQVGVHPLQVLVWWGGLVVVAAGLVTAYERRTRPRQGSSEEASTSRRGRETAEPPKAAVGP